MTDTPHSAKPPPWLAMLPEALLALLFAALAIDPLIGEPLAHVWLNRGYLPLNTSHPAILAILAVEVGFLLPQLTLIDVATRLQKRPPWWLIPPMAIGLLILAPGGAEFLRVLLQNQSLLLVPALWSVFQRTRQLWEMPGKPALERMRVRALTGGRATVGGVMVVLFLGSSIAETSSLIRFDGPYSRDSLLLTLAALYFAACTFDAWRVSRPRFAKHPKPLLWFDPIGIQDDSPL